jgi:hypothetical protein
MENDTNTRRQTYTDCVSTDHEANLRAHERKSAAVRMSDETLAHIVTCVEQIDKDLHRTCDAEAFAGAPTRRGDVETHCRSALRRVLTAYCWYNPPVGYLQSMNFLAAHLLLVYKDESAQTAPPSDDHAADDAEERVFWVMSALLEDCLSDFHTRRMRGLVDILAQFDQLVAQAYVERLLM